MFDIKEIQPLDSNKLTVRDPVTGDKTSWIIEFAGPGHEKSIKLKNQQMHRGLKRARQGKQVDDLEPEEIETNSVDYLVGRMLGWEGLASGGKEVPFSEDTARAFLSNPSNEWLRNQCNKFLTDEASFIRRSAKT